MAIINLVMMCLLFTSCKRISARVTGDLITNEVVDVVEEDSKELPFCRRGSACGYLQVNAFGVTHTQFCRCPSLATVCPLQWDPQDGHSVTMNSQQFKYCDPAPTLHVCSHSEAAYTSAFLFDQASFDVMGVIHNLHCMCPPPRTHVQLGSTEDIIDNMLVLGTAHKCTLLPECEITSSCKEVALKDGKGLVTEKCRCPRRMSCPTFATEVIPNSMNENFYNGNAYSIRCQFLH